jgi:hypothetical protein
MTLMEKLYKFLIVALLLLQLLWFFLPWGFVYDEVSVRSLEWLGYGALIGREAIVNISNISLVLYIFVSVGLFFYNSWARRMYIVLIVIGGITTPLFGLYVSSGYESAIGYFITLGDGFLLAVCYLTSIASKFNYKKT